MAAGWTTKEMTALISVPVPITKLGLKHMHFAQCKDEAIVEPSFDVLCC